MPFGPYPYLNRKTSVSLFRSYRPYLTTLPTVLYCRGHPGLGCPDRSVSLLTPLLTPKTGLSFPLVTSQNSSPHYSRQTKSFRVRSTTLVLPKPLWSRLHPSGRSSGDTSGSRYSHRPTPSASSHALRQPKSHKALTSPVSWTTV